MLSKKPYKLSFSIGFYTMSGQNVDDFFVQMDRAMYDDKRSFYSNHEQDRRHTD